MTAASSGTSLKGGEPSVKMGGTWTDPSSGLFLSFCPFLCSLWMERVLAQSTGTSKSRKIGLGEQEAETWGQAQAQERPRQAQQAPLGPAPESAAYGAGGSGCPAPCWAQGNLSKSPVPPSRSLWPPPASSSCALGIRASRGPLAGHSPALSVPQIQLVPN